MREERVALDDNGRRLDRVLRKAYPSVPPGAIAGAVRRGEIRLNGKRTQNDTRVTTGDRITVPDWERSGRDESRTRRDGAPSRRDRSASRRDESRSRRDGAARYHPDDTSSGVLRDDRIVSGEWSIPILERSDDWIALNKPAGLSSHGEGGLDGILRAVAAREGWWSESLSFRPGPVHRLDRNTSGLQLFSLSAEGARNLTGQIRRRSGSKIYLALVSGHLPRRELCDRRLAYDRSRRTAIAEPETAPGSDPALRRFRFSTARTHFFPLAFSGDREAGRVAAVPETGRTHQIRAHAAELGIPLLGDTKYGGPGSDDHGYILHALLFATHDPGHVWTAPLASSTYGILRTRFGDLSGIEQRLREILPVVCTGCPGNITLTV